MWGLSSRLTLVLNSALDVDNAEKRCFKEQLFIVGEDFHNLQANYDVAVDSSASDCLIRPAEEESARVLIRGGEGYSHQSGAALLLCSGAKWTI